MARHFMEQYNKMLQGFEATVPSHFDPEAPLEAIGMPKPHIDFLASMMVFTVRQFANMSQSLEVEFNGFLVKAVEAMEQYNAKSDEKYAKQSF
eukprot:Phypoly_transcript_21547.p1 GENE.Phypoly_transcript_21547~~Phypoly_transcript_21547.p1  ORF type:complete len:108 (+),score=15.46 Phypoly_transcript_21547:48-326(+)